MASKTGGQLLVESFIANGVTHVFCVAGESYLPLLDALYDVQDKIKVITCRHESGAAFMAEAYGKLTGKPGVCLVTRGPGACNGSIGVHTALQDQSPMLYFIGQVATDVIGREGFQEVDFRAFFAPLAKWSTQIDHTARTPEIMNRAFHLAQSGRPGPVTIALPEDVLREKSEVKSISAPQKARSCPNPADIARLQELLGKSKRPLAILGGGGWDASALADIQAFLEQNHIPAACAFRRQDLLDNHSPSYAGDLGFGADPKLVESLKNADLLLVIGDRLGEVTSREYQAFDIPDLKPVLIHVQADGGELNHVYRTDLPIACDYGAFARALRGIKLSGSWQDWTRQLRKDYESSLIPGPFAGAVDMAAIVKLLNDKLPKDAITTNDAGNFSGWLHRFYQWRKFPTQLAPGCGAMGYAVPAAVVASLLHPDKTVLGFVGDGGFMMTGQELATAMQHGARPIIILVNNGMYGTIRMHQEKFYPKRTIATDLKNPDFVALAQSYGAFGAKVEKTADFWPAFEAAQKSGISAVIEIRLDPENITSRTTLSALRKMGETK